MDHVRTVPFVAISEAPLSSIDDATFVEHQD
jgi:hypothetical protein